MKRLIRWLFRDMLVAEYNVGYRDGTGAILDGLKRAKGFIAGEAPIAGLNEFLARETPRDVAIMGCSFNIK